MNTVIERLAPIQTKRAAYKTPQGFEYQKYFDYFKKVPVSIWDPMSVNMSSDIKDFANATKEVQDIIAGILKGFTIVETHVGNYWTTEVTKMFPKHEIVAMCDGFGFMERIHAWGYNHLSESLNLNDFDAFLSDPTVEKKINYFLKHKSDLVSLAVFSGGAEGVMLFGQFATLLSLSRDGKFKGLAQIISWSSLDEACLHGDTEILTPSGWKKISEYQEGELIAQFDPTSKGISFVKPTKYIEKQSFDMYELNLKQRFYQRVTPDHTIVSYKYDEKNKTFALNKSKASEWAKRQSYIPVAGYLENRREINALDQFMIALQADGYIRKKPSKREVLFSFKRERKISRFNQLAEQLKNDYGFTYNKYVEKDGYTKFSLLVPDEYLNYRSKRFSEVYTLDNIPNGFLEEVLHWDGHNAGGEAIYYSSKIKENVEFIQTVGSLSGYYGHINVQEDNRWTKPCVQYRINLKKTDAVRARYSNVKKQTLENPLDVYCFKVPTQAFLIRDNGLISITGNCHSQAGCDLFKDLVSERGITTKELDAVYEGIDTVLNNEINFNNQIFKVVNGVAQRSLPFMTVKESNDYLRIRANDRLTYMGLEPQYEISGEGYYVKEWFENEVFGVSSNDFFWQSNNGQTYTALPSQDFAGFDYSRSRTTFKD